jgi:predicted ArsR family transcriptional regulator
MSPTLDSRDREILEHLHRENGADVQELCEHVGVTRNAIRHRISRLESALLVQYEVQSQTRGRPRHVYRITAEGLHSLGENYRELTLVLWKVITGVTDASVREQLLVSVRDAFAERFRHELKTSGTLDNRLDQLADEMKSSGFQVESDHTGGMHILRETSCPFPMLADVDDTICQIERQVLEQVLGTQVEFRSRCRDGDRCCEFQVTQEV